MMPLPERMLKKRRGVAVCHAYSASSLPAGKALLFLVHVGPVSHTASAQWGVPVSKRPATTETNRKDLLFKFWGSLSSSHALGLSQVVSNYKNGSVLSISIIIFYLGS